MHELVGEELRVEAVIHVDLVERRDEDVAARVPQVPDCGHGVAVRRRPVDRHEDRVHPVEERRHQVDLRGGPAGGRVAARIEPGGGEPQLHDVAGLAERGPDRMHRIARDDRAGEAGAVAGLDGDVVREIRVEVQVHRDVRRVGDLPPPHVRQRRRGPGAVRSHGEDVRRHAGLGILRRVPLRADGRDRLRLRDERGGSRRRCRVGGQRAASVAGAADSVAATARAEIVARDERGRMRPSTRETANRAPGSGFEGRTPGVLAGPTAPARAGARAALAVAACAGVENTRSAATVKAAVNDASMAAHPWERVHAASVPSRAAVSGMYSINDGRARIGHIRKTRE